MRLFLAGIVHEANIFSPIPTTLESFAWQYWDPAEGPKPDDIDTLAYGFALEAAQERGHEVVQSLFCSAQASGAVLHKDWLTLKERVCQDLAQAGSVDAVFLFLHGSEVVEGITDAEADMVKAVKAVVGEGVPIGVMLDLHTNMTAAKLSTGALWMGCKEYPHIDYEPRSIEMLDILEGAASGALRPVVRAASVAMVGAFPTTTPQMGAFLERVTQCETGAILSVSPLHGFFGASGADLGASVIVIADHDVDRALQTALKVGQDFARTIETMDLAGLTIDEALDAADQSEARPVIIADSADNPGGGAAGDATFILSEMVRRKTSNAALGMIWDPVAVDIAHAVGAGAKLSMRIGGKTGPLSGDPVDIAVTVTSVREDAKQALFGVGAPDQPLGKSACLQLPGGLDIIINAVRQQVFSPHCFTAHGVDLSTKQLVVVKSTQHFEHAFAPIAGKILRCNAPGTVTANLTSLPYAGLRRPLYPLDRATPIGVSPF
ncbi:MAG: M81 family metallopeptidase [Pseudomonadota bacterium]